MAQLLATPITIVVALSAEGLGVRGRGRLGGRCDGQSGYSRGRVGELELPTVAPRCEELCIGRVHRVHPCTATATYAVTLKRVIGLRFRCTLHMRWNHTEGTLVSATPLKR